MGYEPSKNVADTAMSNGIKTINSFFAEKNLHLAEEYVGKTEVICASNVICHIPDLSNDLIISLDNSCCLTNGAFIFEEPYLGSMFQKVSYDQIYDEHIYIFSASSVEKIFKLYTILSLLTLCRRLLTVAP